MGFEAFDHRDYGAQRRHADAIAAAIAYSAHAVGRLLRMAGATLRRARGTAIVWWQRASERRQLLALDDRCLRDIGMTRYDAIHEGRKPFWRP
jgi:uncharacterized protein YjiS (DUF1127 family)